MKPGFRGIARELRAYLGWAVYANLVRAGSAYQRLRNDYARLVTVVVALPALPVAATLALVVAFGVTAAKYRGEVIWPPLFGEALATAAGVYLAIYFERKTELRRDAVREIRMRESVLDSRLENARRALLTISAELETLEAALQDIRTRFVDEPMMIPEIPTGAWRAVDRTLAAVLDDYEFLAAVAGFYDRAEDLRAALRLRADATTRGWTAHDAELGRQILDVLAELEHAVVRLRELVVTQISAPAVTESRNALLRAVPASG